MIRGMRTRLRIVWAAVRQDWHQKTCGECRQSWWSEGPDRELIGLCDACEAALLDRMADQLEQAYQRHMAKEANS